MSTVNEILANLHEKEQWDIEGQKDKLKKVYDAMPSWVQQISETTGIAPEKVMKYANYTAHNHTNVKVHDVVSIIRDFYLFKDNDEKGEYDR